MQPWPDRLIELPSGGLVAPCGFDEVFNRGAVEVCA